MPTVTNYKGIKGIGSITAHTFMHLSSLLGLIPLVWYKEETLAHDHKLSNGPARFISRCTGLKCIDKINECFFKLHKDLEAIWGDSITKSYLENLFSEENRILEYSESQTKGKKFDRTKHSS